MIFMFRELIVSIRKKRTSVIKFYFNQHEIENLSTKTHRRIHTHNVHTYIYIYIYIYAYSYMCVCVYVWLHTHTYIYIYIYAYTHICVCVCVCVIAHTLIYIYIYIFTRSYIYMCVIKHTFVRHTYVHPHKCPWYDTYNWGFSNAAALFIAITPRYTLTRNGSTL